jgi:DNA-binding protein YbaB
VFPPGPEGLDVQQLLQQAQRMQEQLMSAQQNLAETEITGTAGGGPADVETLCDLVVAAVRDAHAQAQRLAADQMGPLGQGLGGLLGADAGATEKPEGPVEPGSGQSLGRPPLPSA